MREEDAFAPVFGQFMRKPCPQVFYKPADRPWKLESLWEDGYFKVARETALKVASGQSMPGIEGVVALFLYRHYLELAIKFITFHARWLRDAATNASDDEIEDVRNIHSLQPLWDTAKKECVSRMGHDEWARLDIPYVDQCIRQFHEIDPTGYGFRYHGPKFGVEKDPAARAERQATLTAYLTIDFAAIIEMMDHVEEVLDYIDLWMYETHGQNAEWESDLNSL